MTDNDSITRRGQFLRWNSPRGVPALGIESRQLKACVEQAARERVCSLFGSGSFGFHGDNLDFLNELPFVEHVWFFDISLRDVGGLYALKGLKSFGIHPKRPGIDFARFPKLESMVWSYNANDVGVDALPRLKELFVWHYNPKHKSFDGLAIPASVEQLDLTWTNPRDLSGLPRLPKLRRLEIHRSRNMASLAGIEHVAPNVEEIIVTTSRHLGATPNLNRLAKLKWALFSGDEFVPRRRVGK